MPTEYVNIGPAPFGEECAQVGDAEYHERSRRECSAFIAQLRRVFGPEPEGARLLTRSFQHDFGSYREVEVAVTSRAGSDWAYKLESQTPEHWDAESLIQLGLQPRE
jgi:hypothetical protein